MNKYRVISAFNDLLDNGFLYTSGSAYPREGAHPTEGRIAELASSKNKRGKPLIEEVLIERAEPPKKKRGRKNEVG